MGIPKFLRFKSITHRLIAGCILAVLLVYAWSAIHMHQLIHDTTTVWLVATGRYWVDALKTDLAGTLEAVEISTAVLAGDDASGQSGLQSLLQAHPLLSAVARGNTSTGQGWEARGSSPPTALSPAALAVLLARCEGASQPALPFWTLPHETSIASGGLAVSYCVPLASAKTLVVEVGLDWLDERIASRLALGVGPEALVSSRPFVIALPGRRDLLPGSEQQIPLGWLEGVALDAPALSVNAPIQEHLDAQRLMIYTTLPRSGWLLGLAFSRAVIDRLEYRYIGLMLRAMIRDMLLICLAVALISRRTTRSLRALIANTEDIAQGDLDTVLPELHYQDEVGRLTEAFRRMRDALRTYIRELKESTAARQHLESELSIAGQIQRDMVPRVEISQQIGRPYELSTLLQPARQVGGDFYDFFLLEDQQLCLVIGDVAGKGMPAALLMARAVTLIRASARQMDRPAGILTAVNRELCQNNEECRFVTLFCAVLDLPSGQLDYASSGHDAPLLLRGSTASFLELDTGPSLGLDEEAEFPGYRQQLRRDDLLLLYTDGLTEAMNPRHEIFGEDRLLQVLSSHATGNPARLIRTLQYHLKQFIEGAPPSDDLTLLAIQYLPSSPFQLENRTVEWKIKINSELTEVVRLKTRLGELLQGERLAVESIEDAQLIVEEVVVNILEHAEGIGAGDFIELTVNIDDQRLNMRFEDRAAPFDPISNIQPANLDMDDDERAIGGLGFFLVRELAAGLDYAYRDGKNILTIEQHIQHRS